ncbi:MAG TPA: N-acetylmuramoyl-L-alanine amidase [Trueperaceae bacterium]|nr:N-acetylmuramoyl-L-alanine amidase [Trueperaceae bacterium]
MLGRDDVHEGGLLGGAGGRPRAHGAGAAGDAGAAAAQPGAARAAPVPRRASTPASARRVWLAGGFLLALGVLLALNWSSAFGAVGDPARGLAPDLRQALNGVRGPVRIGLQVGHLNETAMPNELAKLRTSTGAEVGGLNEVDVNLAIVRALAVRLRTLGFEVDELGATVPAGYRATLVLAVHADASPDAQREGYKSAHYLPLRNARDPLLKLDVDRAVLGTTPLGDDDANVSIDMLEYYAFNARRFRHAVARGTPALIVEMGYLTNRRDRALLRSPAPLANALADGVVQYLHDVQRIPPGPPAPAGEPARAGAPLAAGP